MTSRLKNLRLNLYDHLYRYLDNPPKIQPWLAETTASPMRTEMHLHPSKGAKFHTGDEVTAEAVKLQHGKALALGKGSSALFKPILDPGGISVKSRYVIEFNLRKLCPLPLHYATFCIVNPKVVEGRQVPGGVSGLPQTMAGSGSYIP